MGEDNYSKKNTADENEKEKLIEIPDEERLCRIQWQVSKVLYLIMLRTISNIIELNRITYF